MVLALTKRPHQTKERRSAPTKYLVDIPVAVAGLQYLHDLVKGRGKRGAEDSPPGFRCVQIMPCSFMASHRAGDYEVGSHLQELALPLPALAATADRKEAWWHEDLNTLCGN